MPHIHYMHSKPSLSICFHGNPTWDANMMRVIFHQLRRTRSLTHLLIPSNTRGSNRFSLQTPVRKLWLLQCLQCYQKFFSMKEWLRDDLPGPRQQAKQMPPRRIKHNNNNGNVYAIKCSRMRAPMQQVLCDSVWPSDHRGLSPPPLALCPSFLNTGRKCIAHKFLLLTHQKNSFTFIFWLFSQETVQLTLLLSLSTCSEPAFPPSDHAPYAIICWDCTFSWLTVTVNFRVSGTHSS